MRTITECAAVIFIIIFCSETCSGDECGIQNFQDKIINGNATAIDEYPWTVLIRYKEPITSKESWGCGGSLVSKKTILTAAHCVDTTAISSLGEIQFARLGEYDYTKENDCVVLNGFEDCADRPIDIKVSSVVIHPERSSESKLHDIAILILQEVAPYTDFIRPICLPQQSIDYTSDSKGIFYVAGWGWTIGSFQSPSNVKRHTPVNHVNISECRKFYRNINDKWQICAGGANGQNACKGDSGGPLMFSSKDKWTLVGIVSFGPLPCGRAGFDGAPAVFTRISSYLLWIKSVLIDLIDQDKVAWEK
ncbi:Melanization protease 1 [Pseudolycoriella hygida]|uniref:Melanization protease 1 n=1 Tax=Pseudolycoriella hygida TaxID=35572 RepID=A0A9Q0MWK1_9DIPT|nr:Melanization protease 1 [Pseudolycoriella hygida]